MKATLPIFLTAFVSAAVVYTFFRDPVWIGWFGNALQLAGLLLAALNLNIARKLYRSGDNPRAAWMLLTIGIVLWTFAQTVDAYHEIFLEEVPYGTLADVFWVLGYIPIVIGLVILIRNFLATGLPAGSKSTYLFIALISFIVFVFFLKFLILPDLNNSENTLASKFLDVAYPALDTIVIAFAAALVRISWVLRGGNLSKTWQLLCIGFVMVAAADLILTNIEDIDSSMYRFLDLLYFAAYFSIAIAGRFQVRMLQQP
jgi:hypothetical protein